MPSLKSLLSVRLRKELTVIRPRLFRMALAWSGSTHQADDLVQEAMVKALKNLGQLKDHGVLEKWVFDIRVRIHS